jgi:hypothetical protein
MKEIANYISEDRPWPGLASYTLNDSRFFLGRSQEIAELERQILSESFLCLYGPSGVGKSSLLQAGIGERMKTHGFFPVFIRLDHQNGNEIYSVQVIKAVKESIKLFNIEPEQLTDSVFPDDESLWEFFHRYAFWDSRNKLVKPLLIFDQFEEIFTLTDFGKNAKVLIRELGELAENVVPETIQKHLRETNQKLKIPTESQNYRIIVSLREDFLAQLETVTKRIPAFRKNRFPVKALTGLQALEIINIPGEKIIDEGVALAIIENISSVGSGKNEETPLSERIVEPALISLFCRELNEQRMNNHKPRITIEQVKEQGENILINFYDCCFSLVSEETESFIEEKLLTESGFRKPVPLEDFLSYGIPLLEIDTLVNQRLLRKEDRLGILWVEYSHDILTKIAVVKRGNRRNEQELKKEKKRSEQLFQEQLKQKRKAKIRKYAIVSLVFLFILSGFSVYYCWFMPHDYYYAQLIKRNGFFEGLNSLSKAEASHRSVYFKLSRKGIFSYFNHMEALNGYHQLTTENGMSTYLVNKYDEKDVKVVKDIKDMLKTVCQWNFVANDAGEIVSEMAFDKDTNLVYNFIHTRTYETPTGKQSICQFSDTYGLPFKQRINGGNYLRISYDKRGFEVKIEYFDENGNPKTNMNEAYGEIHEYNQLGLETLNASIDQFGNYMIDKAGNTGQLGEYDNHNHLIKSISFDTAKNVCAVTDGYAIGKYEYDEYGNQLSEFYYDKNEKPCLNLKTNVHGSRYYYNDYGFNVKKENIGLDGKSLVNSKLDSVAVVAVNYDHYGNQICWEKFDINMRQDVFKDIVRYESVYNSKGEIIQSKNFIFRNNSLKRVYEFKAFKDKQGNDTLRYWFSMNDSIPETYVRQKFDSLKKQIYWGYFGKSMSPIMYSDDYNYYHEIITVCTYGDTITSTSTYYDMNSKRITNRDGVNKLITKSLHGNIIRREDFDSAGGVIKGYTFSYDKDNRKTSQQYIRVSGIPFKGDKDAFYYDARVVWNLQDTSYSEFVGFNEFNEPSYVETSKLVYHKWDISTNEYFDEQDKKIESMPDFMKSLHQVVLLSLISKNCPAYNEGVKDGDILIRYNNWKYDPESGFQRLVEELGNGRNKIKVIEIVRFPECKIHSFTLPVAISGMYLNAIHYTPKEFERIMSIINKKLIDPANQVRNSNRLKQK